MRTKSLLFVVMLASVLGLISAAAPVEESPAHARDVRYPVYVKPGFSFNRFRSLASKKGFPPSWVPLSKPPDAAGVIPLCAMADYQTAEKSSILSWRCTWDEEIKGPDAVQFELAAYHENWGWVEATAILLDTAYFELVPAGWLGESGERAPVLDIKLASGETQTVTLDRATDDSIIPIMTVNVYESGGDEDFQFYISDDSFAADEAGMTTFEIVAENGNEESFIEAHLYFIKPLVPGVEWSLVSAMVENGTALDYPESDAIPFNASGFNTLLFPSLVSYHPDTDGDFEVGNVVMVDGPQAVFQMNAQHGVADSWATWMNVIIQVPAGEED